MPGATYLAGEGVTLRTIEEEDLPFLRDAINDPRVREYLPHRPPLNLDQEREFYESVVCDDGSVNLLVCVGDDPAGTVGLDPIDPVAGTAEIGLFLVPEYWGGGHGTETARLVVDYAFQERRLHRVAARVIEGNEASRRIWESLGFRHEATFREAAFHGGAYADQRLYAVLEDEWRGGAEG